MKKNVIWLDVALELATPEKIDMYIDHLLRKRMHLASINLYLVIIRVFYDYLRYEEKVDLTNHVKRNRRLRVPKPLSRSLRDQEVEKLFGAIKNKRDITMFKLMLRCGLRVEEVSNLTLGAIDLKRCRLIVEQGKGGKGRVVYMSSDAHDAFKFFVADVEDYSKKLQMIIHEHFRTYNKFGLMIRGKYLFLN